jgi:hypothetical protein
MSKRIKRVFSSADQVIHLWANQTQSDARCANVFFEGKSVYSYGRHYELGRLVQFNGVTVALVNNTGYSVTTSKHISAAYHAVAHLPRIMTKAGDGFWDIKKSLIETQGNLVESLMGLFSQRCFWSGFRFDKVVEQIAEFNQTATALGFKKLCIDVTDDFKALVNEHVKLAEARQLELTSPEAIAKREAKALKRAANAVQTWRNGGALTKELRNLRPMLLRINGDEVQTTGGASVPLTHALRLLRMIEHGTAKAGEPVGSFKLDEIQGETIKIGCHTIALDEARTVLKPRALEVVA